MSSESSALLAEGGTKLTEFLTEQILLHRGADAGPDAGTAAERDAGGLIALLDGLICHIARTQTAESATETLKAQIGYVLG